jgi:hypothetical protein
LSLLAGMGRHPTPVGAPTSIGQMLGRMWISRTRLSGGFHVNGNETYLAGETFGSNRRNRSS